MDVGFYEMIYHNNNNIKSVSKMSLFATIQQNTAVVTPFFLIWQADKFVT